MQALINLTFFPMTPIDPILEYNLLVPFVKPLYFLFVESSLLEWYNCLYDFENIYQITSLAGIMPIETRDSV